MKAILIFLLLAGIVGSATAQLATNVSARFKIKIVLSEAKSLGGAVFTATSPSPEGISTGDENKSVVTSPGHEYELTWKFAGQNGAKDVYHFTFTRMVKEVGVSDKTTTSKDISFDGRRATIFEDELHTVIMESPNEKDLK